MTNRKYYKKRTFIVCSLNCREDSSHQCDIAATFALENFKELIFVVTRLDSGISEAEEGSR